jgi:hypothetical protein
VGSLAQPSLVVTLVRALLLSAFALGLSPCRAQPESASDLEHVILAGGPALQKWERLRVAIRQHDKWRANFIRASTLRMVELRAQYGPDARIAWIVYRPAYLTGGADDGKFCLQSIESLALNYRVQLIWVDPETQSVATINKRPAGFIKPFDYFGHANPHAFMLDYGIETLAIPKAWIHERDLAKIQREFFSPEPLGKNWGCHTRQSMSLTWRQSLGIRLIGTEGRTNYADVSQKATLPSTDLLWIR